ncbi:fre family ferric-chelate reductase [Botryosphaeria dothidea]|uniref:Fre family ferric-chelate reductase n=1 Tax=Botryosphaeria dothidea TaxID=55169 RepID=A0A8H4N6A1_9PEZI|nr:fre family ferric-chelate reductase [Botryosphaeria dothidea]
MSPIRDIPPSRISRPALLLLLLLCLFPFSVRADGLLTPDQLCVRAVFMGYNSLAFAEGDQRATNVSSLAARAANDFCHNELKATSIYAAAKVYCAGSDDPRDFEPIIELLREHCRKWGEGAPLMPVPDAVAKHSVEELRRELRSVDFEGVPKGEELAEVMLISESYYKRCFETIFSWEYTMWAHKRGGTMMYEFWAVVVVAAAAVQLYRRFLRDPVHRLLRGLRKSISFSMFQTLLERIERLTPESLSYERVPGAVAAEKDSRSCFNFKFFPVGETMAIWLYWILSITLNFANYQFYNESIYFPKMPHQVARYSADRTGILSYANLPMLWLFSGRNNILMWATGWKFPTFIRFHLHVAWIATLEAIAHSVLYTALCLDSGILWPWLKTDWFFMGVIATIVMTLLLVISTPVFLRERYYELFIDSHIISSLAVIIGLFVHTGVFDHEYDWYLWVPAIFWVFDRAIRTLRILVLNLGFKRGRLSCTKTMASYDPASNIITLEMEAGRDIPRPRPGQYYFLYQPFSLRGYENHPMTLGSWRRHDPNPTTDNEEEAYPLTPTTTASSASSPALGAAAAADDDTEQETPLHPCTSTQPLLSSSPSPSSTSSTHLPSSTTPTTLTFWIRPYDGWTRRLRDQCIKQPSKKCHPFILLEGPYGATHALPGTYDATILVAGGSGISAAVPYLREHERQQRPAGNRRGRGVEEREDDDDEEEEGQRGEAEAGSKRLRLVWAAREEPFIRDVVRRELRGGLASGCFAASLYCTSRGSRDRPAGSADEGAGAVRIEQGRPDVRGIIAETARAVCADRVGKRGRRRGRIAVLLCGPPAMASGVEAAVRSCAEEFDCWLDYFDEVFSW